MRSSLFKSTSAALFLAFLATSPVAANAGEEAQWSERHSFHVIDQDLRSVLQEFGASLGIPIAVSADVEGRVANLRGTFNAEEFLERISSEQSLSWFFDGDVVHITEARQNRSLVIDFATVDLDRLNDMLDSMGVMNKRFPIREVSNGRVGVLIAPPRYVELVEQTFTLLGETQEAPAPGQPQRRVQILVVRGDGAQLWQGARVKPMELISPEDDAALIPDDKVGDTPDTPETPTPESKPK